MILALAVTLSEATQYRRHELPGGVAGFLPRMRIGRNSKLRPDTSAEAGAGDTELGVTGRVLTPGNWYCPGICSVVIKQSIYYTKEWY